MNYLNSLICFTKTRLAREACRWSTCMPFLGPLTQGASGETGEAQISKGTLALQVQRGQASGVLEPICKNAGSALGDDCSFRAR